MEPSGLKETFEEAISHFLRFKLGLEIYEYTLDDKIRNFREFEEELDVDYPIKGTEVRFGANIFHQWRSVSDNYKIVNGEKDMSSFDITGELAGEPFRYKEMTFVYLFSVLEDFGNSIISLVNPPLYIEIEQSGKSWHSRVNKSNKKKGVDMAECFALPFKLQVKDVNRKLVDLFYDLKQKRNRIAHELSYPEIHDFKEDVESIIVMTCYLYYINSLMKEDVKIYPWEDYDEHTDNDF